MSSFPPGEINPELAPEIAPALTYEQYEALADMEVDADLHAKGRRVFSALMNARFGDMIIDTSQGFKDHADEIAKGGVVVASVHRDELETLDLPCALEHVGIHHARPIGKSSIVEVSPFLGGRIIKNLVTSWGMVPVKRGAKDLSGLNRFQEKALDPERDGGPQNLIIYDEKGRVRSNVETVRPGGSAAVLAAGEHDSLFAPVAMAGLSTEIDPDTRKKLRRDKRIWFNGGHLKRVYAFGDPFRLGVMPMVAVNIKEVS